MVLGIERGSRNEGYVRAAGRIGIPYRLIDGRANNVMQQIGRTDGFIWHWSHMNAWEKRIARAIITGAQNMGKPVYPDIRTCWMFDDKIYEKYLLESLGAPAIPSYVFFDETECERWLRRVRYPVVYKLASGAGSTNVRLVRNYTEGMQLVHRHFAGGTETGRRVLRDRPGRRNFQLPGAKTACGVNADMPERGAVLFQEFVPGNRYDIRVTTIGNKNLIFRRYVREHDFRASGSGMIDYKVSKADTQTIVTARKITDMIQAQTMTYDFVYSKDYGFQICEMSYGFAEYAIHNAPGWYDNQAEYHEEKTDVFEEVVKMVVRGMKDEKQCGSCQG